MLRLAVELARDRLGLEGIRLYIRDRSAPSVLMRGTWATSSTGELIDEGNLFHELTHAECDALVASRVSGGASLSGARSLWSAKEQDTSNPVAQGVGVVATPLVAAHEVVGVMYHEYPLARCSVEEGKQAAAAVFCTLLAALYVSRRRKLAWQPLAKKPGQSPMVERILAALNEGTPMTGERLAGELGVSPGHLARSFKREMGVSLVDYRNRLRIDRFFEAIQRAGSTGNLLTAALEAGFGSYAQFHRVYRKFLGTTPRDIFANGTQARGPASPSSLAASAERGSRALTQHRSRHGAARDAADTMPQSSVRTSLGDSRVDHSKRGSSTLVA
jgi:methylphosphotriester-DNA--protein-cysteine methyltransferase